MNRLFLACACLLSPTFALEGSYSILTSTSTGLAVGMNLYLPPGYNQAANASRRYPLMVFLGGAGERGDPTDAAVVLQKSTVWGPAKEIRYADRDFPFIVVTPISTEWYSSLPVEYNTMVEYLKIATRVDPDRIYFTGACAGASGVMEFAQVNPQQVAAMIPALTQTPLPRTPQRLQEIPTWFFHAFADPFVSREQTITWADAIANSFGFSPISCMDNYPYGTASNGSPTYNPNNQTGSFRPGSGWSWTTYTVAAEDSLLLFTMMSTDLHNVWHYAVTKDSVLHWLTKQRRQSPFGGTPVTLPGRIEAEAFDFGGHLRAYRDSSVTNSGGHTFRNSVNPYDGTVDNEQVDVAAVCDGTAVTATAAGEWIEYTVNCSESGSYALGLRVRATASGGAVHLESDGVSVTPSIAIPTTADFTTMVVAGPTLTAGPQVLRLVIEQGGFDLNWFEIVVPAGPANLIIDNRQNDKVTTSGAWALSSFTPGFHAQDYLSAAPGATASATFRPNLPRSGAYEVSLWYPSNSSRGTADVTVIYGSGSQTLSTTVDQRIGGGAWRVLGSFEFVSGTTGSVTIGAAGSSGYISADAVRFDELATTVPPDPIDLIIDNPDCARVTTSGPWTVSTYTSGFYGPNYLSAVPGSDCVATFRPNLATDGFFTVSMRYPANGARGVSPVAIAYDGGLYATTVDQRCNGDTWITLGSFAFAAGGDSAVTIRSLGAGGYVSADAVRFTQVPALPPLDLTIDNDDAGRVTIIGAWSATTTAPGFYGVNYVSTAPSSDKRVVYRPNLPRGGTFAISIWYPATPSRGTAPVTISSGDGSLDEVINVDQRSNGGRWNLLGIFPLDAGSTPSITIGSFASGGWIGADAIRLVETEVGGSG